MDSGLCRNSCQCPHLGDRMTSRYLTWHVPAHYGSGTNLRETYVMDQDYQPQRVWVHLSVAPTGVNPLIIDINVDGVSLFALRPTIQYDETEFEEEDTAAFSSVP